MKEDEGWNDWVRQAFKTLDSNQDGVICEDDMRMASIDEEVSATLILALLLPDPIHAYSRNRFQLHIGMHSDHHSTCDALCPVAPQILLLVQTLQTVSHTAVHTTSSSSEESAQALLNV